MTNKQLEAALRAAKAENKALRAAAAQTTTKVAKPSTKTEAIKAWKEARGITPEAKAVYDQLEAANFTLDWEKWVAKRNFTGMKLEERKAANRAEANRIRNVYRKLAGLPLVTKQ